MTDKKSEPSDYEVRSERELTDLLQKAGPRPTIPERDRLQIRNAAEEAWRALAHRQRRKTSRRRIAWLAAAALAAVAVTLFLQKPSTTVPMADPVEIAYVAVSSGTSWIEESGAGRRHEARADDVVNAGSFLETSVDGSSASRIAIRFRSGANLRLDVGTRILIESESRIELLRGAVYLDSEPNLQGSDLVVATALGEVYEIGTQFEARLLTNSELGRRLRVRVREGEVRIEQDEKIFEASMGEGLTVLSDGKTLTEEILPYDSSWDWILEMAMPLSEGVTCRGFLHWLGRETGWRIIVSPELEDRLDSNELVGAQLFNDTKPNENLDLKLASCGLDYAREAGQLVVSNKL
jgi:hypothetical protein